MDKYTDEKLRERLKAYGQDVGPINNSTRPYWQKALTKLTLQHVVSPKCAAEKKVKKNTPISPANRRNVTCRSRSVDSPKYADQSFSENDLSDWEFDSVLTDSPGSTPFPAKISRNKKSSSNQIISSSEATKTPVDILESVTRDTNRQTYLSMTPNSTRNSEEINLGKSTRIQKSDRYLREKLKEFGVHVERGSMNEAIRNVWKKRLDKLMSGSSPVESNSDSEIIYPLSYGSRMRIKPRNGTIGIRNTSDEEYEDLDYSKNEYQCCSQNIHASEGHLYECLKLFFRILLNVIFLIIVLIVVVLLVSPTKDDESFEADD